MTPQPPAGAPSRVSALAPSPWPLLLIPLAALFAVHPLIVHGCSCGHDFDVHLLNWLEAANQFSHGNLHPHWAFTPAFNAGEPRFVFYPPISWALGAVLGLILTHLPGISEAAGWTAVPILFTWIALALSGLTLYRLARVYASANAALIAAILYLANPYMLFTAYERTAYAELLAAAWMPLLLQAVLSEEISIPRIALPVALLWLTNAPAAVMGSYTLALLAALRLATNPGAPHHANKMRESRHLTTLRLAFKIFAGTTLGLALAAFYILPAASERRFVQISMVIAEGLRIDQNFLFERTGSSPFALDHDAVLHTASLIAVVLLAATAAALAATLIHRRSQESSPANFRLPESGPIAAFPTFRLAILTAGIALLLTPWSAPIWNHVPQAAFLQFPWRLLAILAPIFALALARSLDTLENPRAPSIAALSRWVGSNTFTVQLTAVLALTAALALPAYHLFRQPCDPEDTTPARLALFHSHLGTDPIDEYTPTTADNDALKPNSPPYWLALSPAASAPAAAVPGPAPTHLNLFAPRAGSLILNLRNYPSWRITRNGATSPSPLPRLDGLIAIPIPAGPSTIDIRYAHTLDQTFGDVISLLALALYLFTLRAKSQTPAKL